MSKMNAVDEELEQMMARHSVSLDHLRNGEVMQHVPEFSKVKKGLKELQKDALGYEMLRFITSEVRSETTSSASKPPGLMQAWMEYFKQALEDLLANVLKSTHDDIERQCFVSKIYCWYSENLTTRVPRTIVKEEGDVISEGITIPFQRRGYHNVGQ